MPKMTTTMKTFARTMLIASSSAVCLMAGAPVLAEEAATLTLEISGMSPMEGFVMIGLYDSEAAWDDGRAVAGSRAEVGGETITAVFTDLPAGSYGVKMYHDTNSNGEMDTNLMGIPSEPFAFSNNARGSFGPPPWSSAVFEVEPDSAVHAIRFE